MKVKATSLNQKQDWFSFEDGTLGQMLRLAKGHGWSPPENVHFDPRHRAFSDEQASALATALERALPGVPNDFGTPRLEYRATAVIAERASNKDLDPIPYSRRNGKQLVEDFITFLRRGGFGTRSGEMEVYEYQDGGMWWCPICKSNFYGGYVDGGTGKDYVTCDRCKTRASFATGGWFCGPENQKEVEEHKDYLDVDFYTPSEEEQRWIIKMRLPNSDELPEESAKEKEEILKTLELLINKLHSFYGAPEGYYEKVKRSQMMRTWSD
jgi:hypothetical protein